MTTHCPVTGCDWSRERVIGAGLCHIRMSMALSGVTAANAEKYIHECLSCKYDDRVTAAVEIARARVLEEWLKEGS